MSFRGLGIVGRWMLVAALFLGAPWPAGWAALKQPAPDSNTLIGIGAVLHTQDGVVKVIEIVPGGPAEREGQLKANDTINAVAQGDGDFVNCAGLPLDKVTEMIRGKKGATVRIKATGANGAFKVVSLVRAEVKLNAQAAVPAPPEPAKDVKLSPENEAKLADALEKITKARRTLLADYMKKRLDELASVTSLDEDGRKAIEPVAAQAIEDCLKVSGTGVAKMLRAEVQAMPGGGAQLFVQIVANAASYAGWIQTSSGVWPTDGAAWKDGLKKILTPAQAALWDAAETKQKRTVEAQIANYLKAVRSSAMQQESFQVEQKVSAVNRALSLPKDRLDKLNALMETTLAQTGSSAQARAEKGLMAMSDDERKSAINGRGYYEWFQPASASELEDIVTKFLTPDESNRLQSSRDVHRKLRAAASGKLLVALLDERVAFTTGQRQELEPIVQRMMQSQADLLADRDTNTYFGSALRKYFGVAGTASPAEIKAILDPIQWQHWQDAAALKNFLDENNAEVPIQLPSEDAAAKPEPAAEPEEVERATSDFLVDKSRVKQERVMEGTVLRAEDIARIVHLPDDAAARLREAACGEADRIVATWNISAGQMVRSRVEGATPDTVKQQLQAIQPYEFQNVGNRGPNDQSGQTSVWDYTVTSVLTADQQKAWKEETDARNAFRTSAISSYIVAGFDETIGLSPDQWPKLEPLIEKVIAQYSDDFGRFMAYNQEGGWFMQPFMMFLPMAGIEDGDLKTLLTADQLKRWKGSQQCSNAESYWSNIKMMHQGPKARKAGRKK